MVEQQTRKPLLKKKPTGKFKMQDFQVEDLAILTEMDACANWSEMGAMKTTTVEWWIKAKLSHIPNPRVLVITSRSGKGTYFESLWEVLPDWDVFSVGAKKNQMVLGGKVLPWNVELPDPLYMRPTIVVAHYHCFTNRGCVPRPKKLPKAEREFGKEYVMTEDNQIEMIFPKNNQLLRMHWDAIIVDEAHWIKDPDAQWTRNIKTLKSTYRHVMTGTGFVNNPAEVWSLLNFLYPDTYTAYWKFREYYCEEEDYSGYRKVVGIKPDKEDEFRELVRRVGVRRTMLECFPDIQEPLETIVPVDLNETQQRMYDEIKEELMTYDLQGVPLHSPNVLSALNRLRQITVATPEVTDDYYDEQEERRIIKVKLTEPSSKLDAVMNLLEELDPDDQIVVFSSFKGPLALLETRLLAAEIPYLRLVAEMNDQKRYELWHDIWPTKKHRVFLCTLALGSESINLTSAHRAIFLDQSWSPAKNTQAIGRVYRPGQTQRVQLIRIMAEGTVDHYVSDKIKEKNGWFKQIFGIKDEDDNGD